MSVHARDEHDSPRTEDGFREWFHSWRYLFLVIAVAGLVLGFYAEENWRGAYAWQRYKETMTAQGERLDSAAFIPPPVADADNFAMTPVLAPLFEFVPGTQRWVNTNGPSLFKDLRGRYDAAAAQVKSHPAVRKNSWVPERTDLVAWAAGFSGAADAAGRKERLVPATFTSREAAVQVLAGLSDFDPVLDELRDASKRPKSRFNLRYEEDNPAGILLPHLAQLKSICQILQLRACAELALGQGDAAFQDVGLMLYLADATRDEPILITHLVRMAELQLALQPLAEGMGTWSEPQLLVLQKRIQGFDFCSDIQHALKAERTFFGSGVIEYIRRSPNKSRLLEQLSDSGMDSGPVGLLLAAAPGGWLYLEQLNMSRAYDLYLLPVIDAEHRLIEPRAVLTAQARLGEGNSTSPVKKFLQHTYFSSMLVPAMGKAAQKAAYGQTAADAGALACAIERYRLAHGQLPDSLEKLVPQFISPLPHDIINGKPLVYRPTPDGHFVFYSVGWNESDDGGLPGKAKTSENDHGDGDWVWADNF